MSPPAACARLELKSPPADVSTELVLDSPLRCRRPRLAAVCFHMLSSRMDAKEIDREF
ncbi:hypothetical protein Dimus_024886, partial [Dionaea muscipula]